MATSSSRRTARETLSSTATDFPARPGSDVRGRLLPRQTTVGLAQEAHPALRPRSPVLDWAAISRAFIASPR